MKLTPDDLEFVPVDGVDDGSRRAFKVIRQGAEFNDAYDRLEGWLSADQGIGPHQGLRIRTTVALHGGEVAGYIATHAHEIHHERLDKTRFERPFSALKVLHLAVNSPFGGRGVGEILLAGFGIGTAALLTRVTGCRFLYLDALMPAVGFYRRLGFEVVPTSKANSIWAPMIFDLKKAGAALDAYSEMATRLISI